MTATGRTTTLAQVEYLLRRYSSLGYPAPYPLPSTHVSLQTPSSDGISDGILATFHNLAYTGQAFSTRLNIIARYVERMLSTSQDGQNPLK
jgi:hypothetical protein